MPKVIKKQVGIKFNFKNLVPTCFGRVCQVIHTANGAAKNKIMFGCVSEAINRALAKEWPETGVWVHGWPNEAKDATRVLIARRGDRVWLGATVGDWPKELTDFWPVDDLDAWIESKWAVPLLFQHSNPFARNRDD